MKILFFGTSEFGLPTLDRLKAAGVRILGVVTQPDRPFGRAKILKSSPVKKWAEENNLDIFQPEKLELAVWKRTIPQADIYIVASYGLIIPKDILELPRYGALNLHPSLLPKYRGASPIQAAIVNGDTETGVTVIKMDEAMDHGPILASEKIHLSGGGIAKITYQELHDVLAGLAADLLIKVLPKYASGEIKPTPQDHSQATYTKIIEKDHARIDWKKNAETVDRVVRAYSNWPVAWTFLDDKRLKIYKATPLPQEDRDGEPGKIFMASNKFLVKCGGSGDGILQAEELQLEGGNRMLAADFVRGCRNLNQAVLF